MPEQSNIINQMSHKTNPKDHNDLGGVLRKSLGRERLMVGRVI